MHPANLAHSYRQVATQTASRGQLVLMLYDGAIKFLERALTGFELEDPLDFNQTVHNNIARAQAIIQELDASLNMEAGGEFSANMRRLYDYFDSQLVESNRLKRAEGVKDVLKRLAVVRGAWAEMIAQNSFTDQPASASEALSAQA